MDRTEHLLTIVAEECVEVAQRATKSLRFSLDERQPGDDRNNAERILMEYIDLLAILAMLCENSTVFEAAVRKFDPLTFALMEEKKVRVEKYLLYSQEVGTLKQDK